MRSNGFRPRGKGRITHAGTDAAIREGICKRGHRLDDWNIYVRPDGGRTCRACRDEKHREWLAAHPGPHR